MLSDISKIGFGGASITSIGSLKDSLQLLETCYDLGVRHYDTAPIYGSGYSEVIYSKFINGKRNQLFLVSKFGLGNPSKVAPSFISPLLKLNKLKSDLFKKENPSEDVNNLVLNNQKNIIDKKTFIKSFESSLKRLKTDYLNAIMLHESLPVNLSDECISELLKFKDQGKVLKIGIATNIDRILNYDNNIPVWCDILQYEGNDKDKKLIMMNRFHKLDHFHHSILKNTHLNENVSYPLLIKEALQSNPNGKIIFSTRSKLRLHENLSLLDISR
jgi:D-threo-aldose 1-dehydrogenase